MTFSFDSQRQLRYIEWKGVKIYDFQKITFSNFFKLYIAGLGVLISPFAKTAATLVRPHTFSTLFKLYNAGLGVLIPKRYHMWGVAPCKVGLNRAKLSLASAK